MVRKESPTFKTLPYWGYVNQGTLVEDSDGQQYLVGPQNDAGFVLLRNQSGGKHKAAEALEAIDHAKYKVVNR